MRSIELSFEHPALLLLALPALALIFLLCRRMRRSQVAPLAERCALVLRVVEVVLTVLILAGISLVSYTSERQTIVLADRSDSMQGVREAVDACLADMAAQGDEVLSVMDFAATCGPLHPLSAPASALSGSATDLQAALHAAAGAFATDAGKRIVLLTDGLATDGTLQPPDGVRVDVVAFDVASDAPEAELIRLELPADAAEGQRISAVVTVRANAETAGVLRIYDGDVLACEQEVALTAGENTVTCALTAGEAGAHAYRAELTAQADTLTQNNGAYGQLRVNEGAEILIVDGTGAQAAKLQPLLESSGYGVTCVASEQMPGTVVDLCAYGLVILMNVNARDLPEGSAENLNTYVHEYGRSVLTTGGENTYFYGNMAGTPFETFLPIDILIEEKESVDPIALMLVIDVTDSMTRQSLGTPIEMARRSAIKCVNALNSNDYVGVITFSDEADVLVEMTSVKDKDAVTAAIEGIETVGPEHLTQFTGALQTACDQLRAFDTLQRKHVIFITDGSPSDKDFEGIVREMKANGITLSTVAVGKLNTVIKLLQELAAIGGGRCYMVESAYDLPDIVTMDTALLQVDYTVHTSFTPQIVDPTFPFSEESVPALLFGSVRASAKPEATVVLASPDGEPVYAVWTYGTGQAASFMSDWSGDWSNNWFTNAPGKQAVLDMVKALLPGAVERDALEVGLEAGGARGMLTLRGDLGQAEEVVAQVLAPDGTQHTAILPRTGENLFEREIPLSAPGLYAVTFTWQGEAGEETREAVVAFNWSKEYEAIDRPGGTQTLMELCAQTGGAMFTEARDVMNVDMEETAVEHDVVLPLAIAVMACLTLDIVLRKTQMKRLVAGLAKRRH